EDQVEATIKEHARQVFDLCQAPLLSVRLLRVTGEHHVVSVSMPHIISDAWSIGILFKELNSLYEAYRQRVPVSLPEPAVRYADFAIWQREWMYRPGREQAQPSELLESMLAYWQEQLQD